MPAKFYQNFPNMTEAEKEHFWSRTTKTPSGCIYYCGRGGSTPRVRVRGLIFDVSRVAYFCTFGVDRPRFTRTYPTCGNPRCINPEHLTKIASGFAWLEQPLGDPVADREKIAEMVKDLAFQQAVSRNLGVSLAAVADYFGN